MRVYLDLVVLLNFLVDLLLLLGTNRLAGFGRSLGRCALAAAVGGVYAGMCMLPGFRFLGSTLWRFVFLGLMGITAFGWGISALRRTVIFAFLSMALGGIASGLNGSGFCRLLGSAGLVALMCLVCFKGGVLQRQYVQVELTAGGKSMKLIALKDTGNTLRDPITGQSVLVADARSAYHLLGLTSGQLADPAATVASGTIPGLRLIPYRSVGQAAGMLVALRMEQVRIGNWKGSTLVAFAPEGLDSEGTYQALVGGIA